MFHFAAQWAAWTSIKQKIATDQKLHSVVECDEGRSIRYMYHLNHIKQVEQFDDSWTVLKHVNNLSTISNQCSKQSIHMGFPSCSPLINKCHQCERNLRGSPSEVARGKLTPRLLAKTFLSRITEGIEGMPLSLSLSLSHTALSILYLRLTHGFLRFAPMGRKSMTSLCAL